MGNRVNFERGISSEFSQITPSADTVYFLTDSKEIYVGADKYSGGGSTPTAAHYTVQWDKVNAQCTRLNDAAGFTTTTTNFKHSGSVNANYSNPFDSIYPWSGRKLCNISIDLYRSLTSSDSITDCVTYWEGDAGFSYNDSNGVWVYTPSFYGKGWDDETYRYFDVSTENTEGAIHYPEMITARWLNVKTTKTINGNSTDVVLPLLGVPLANEQYVDQHTYAKNWGASLIDIYNIDASTLLYIVEYANMNSQTAIGAGVSDLYSQDSVHPSAASSGNTITVTGLASGVLADFVVGAVLSIGTTNGGKDIGRTYITAVSTSGSTTTITTAEAYSVTTSTFLSVHGGANMADSEIGSKSGYIGTNTKCNAYYRGEVLWGNKWVYVLGAYREKTTGHIWISPRAITDNYDNWNNTVQIDTELVLPESKATWVGELYLCGGFSCPLFPKASGGDATNPIGDIVTTPAASYDYTTLLMGGPSDSGNNCGLFASYWSIGAWWNRWLTSTRARLKNPS